MRRLQEQPCNDIIKINTKKHDIASSIPPPFLRFFVCTSSTFCTFSTKYIPESVCVFAFDALIFHIRIFLYRRELLWLNRARERETVRERASIHIRFFGRFISQFLLNILCGRANSVLQCESLLENKFPARQTDWSVRQVPIHIWILYTFLYQ